MDFGLCQPVFNSSPPGQNGRYHSVHLYVKSLLCFQNTPNADTNTWLHHSNATSMLVGLLLVLHVWLSELKLVHFLDNQGNVFCVIVPLWGIPPVTVGFHSEWASDVGILWFLRCWPEQTINTLRPRQNGCHFADETFERIFLNENARISTKISLAFVHTGPINNISAMVQIMAWRGSGDKPLSEPMVVSLLTHICVTLPQWAKKQSNDRWSGTRHSCGVSIMGSSLMRLVVSLMRLLWRFEQERQGRWVVSTDRIHTEHILSMRSATNGKCQSCLLAFLGWWGWL